MLLTLQAAARAAAAASNKQRASAEERIAAAVSDALHLIGGLKMAAPLLAGPSVGVRAVCALNLFANTDKGASHVLLPLFSSCGLLSILPAPNIC
jgi:hypothetical protein